jgi:hypothetical protein
MANEKCNGIGDTGNRVVEALDTLTDVLEGVQQTLERGRADCLRVRLGDKQIASFKLRLTPLAAVGLGLLAVLVTKLALDIVQRDAE